MTLTEYITGNFPQIKAQLNWGDTTTIPVIIAKAAELYGAADESAMTDLTKAHAVTDVAVWRQALNDISLDYAFSADNASYSRQQAVEAVRKNLASAETSAIVYLPGYNMILHEDTTNADWAA
jgi:hypothetical protein